MAAASRLSTRVLLVCAAIGVATGLLTVVAGYVSAPVWAILPIVYGLVLGAHVVPGVIAQALLRMPWVALVTHLLAGIVASAFAPQWVGRYLGMALLIGGLQEGVAALTRYRHWEGWRFFISAVVVGVVLVIGMGFALDAGKLVPWALAVFYALLILGPVLWTFVGLAIGSGLRRAGVARTTVGAVSARR
ncbi:MULTISPECIES: ECF transporter S component [Microbacterium]|uniref:Energy-coupling factor transport system substrate-specific component n=1 Tax=Microbacterium saccharophilum TaxID=1213358 RepID=A0A7Z7D0R6_9MICO|nr:MULTISPECIES: ECF transporter S component [Microbacterium]SFI60584.1 energy-coupling factor transport system substrate-specific component [Microbacterium saccharophilum]